MAAADFPDMPPLEQPKTAPQPQGPGSISAIQQTPTQKVLENVGVTLEKAGQLIDEYAPGSLNSLTGKQIPIIGELRLRDLIPLVGGTEKRENLLTGETETKEVGTPQAFQMAGRGEALTTGRGFTTQMKPDVKLAAADIGFTVAPAIKPAVKATGRVITNLAETPPVGAIKLANFPNEVQKVSQRVDKGSVKISTKVSNDQLLQLAPEYRVKVTGAYKPEGGGQNITTAVNPGNFQDVSTRLDSLATSFPDPLESPERFASMMATVYNSTEVPIPPSWMIRNANNMDEWSGWFGQMSKNQIDEANRGFSVVDKFKTIYTNGTASADTTGRLMLWAMLSRRASAYPHESGFLDLAEQMSPLIQKAVRGEYTPADVNAGLAMIKQAIPEGSPGRSVISNANDFVKTFLVKMSEVGADGRTKLQSLHDMIADQNMTGPQIRRAFYGLAEDVGIKNKVLSFALLVSGRDDVMVLDRIQINRLFGNGEKIYDDVAQIFDGGPGLAMYEGLERSLSKRVNELYARVGRADQASLGRYHWESWVLSSGQEVAHPTLDTIVKAAKGEVAPFANVPVMEGRTHKTAYGVMYQRLPDGSNQLIYPTASGDAVAMTKPQLDELFDKVMKGKEKLVPKDFPGVNFFEKETLPDGKPNSYFGKPWYTWPGVNRERIDELAATIGTRLDPNAGAGSMEGARQGAAANRPVRTRDTANVKRGPAPAMGAE